MTPSHGTAAPTNHRLRYCFGSRGIMQGEVIHRPLIHADGTNRSVRRLPRETRGGLSKQSSTRTVSVQVVDGEQSVHRDGTKHPVIKIDHVVKHYVVYQKQTVGA